MRIGPGVVLPPAPTLTANALKELSAPDRALLFRAAALAAADSVLAPAKPDAPAMPTMPSVPTPIGSPPPTPVPGTAAPGTDALVSLIRALPASTGGSSIDTRTSPPTLALTPPQAGPSITGAANPTVPLAPASPDRLSLSAAALGLRPVLEEPARTAVGQFAAELLESLTGEPRSSLQFLDPGLRSALGADYVALAAKGADAALRLLVQGSVRSEDDQALDLSLRLTVQPQAGAELPDLATRVAIRDALDQLAQARPLLDFPGPAAKLAGQSLQFEAAFDPRQNWTLPGFYLSGMLLIGLARNPEPWERIDEDDGPVADDEPSPQAESESAEQDAPAPRRRRKKKPRPEQPTPDDGGPPIISASHWLELELHHWRTQLRLWMSLPNESLSPG